MSITQQLNDEKVARPCDVPAYDQKAADFLAATGAKIDVEFFYHGPYGAFNDDDDDDDVKRDVFKFTITTSKGSYTNKFGDSIHNTEKRREAVHMIKQGFRGTNNKYFKSQNGSQSGDFDTKDIKDVSAWYRENKTPTAYDILSCITKHDPGTFEAFCCDYGYDSDSITARDVYLDVQKEYSGIARLFSQDELELLREIQ